MDSFLLRSECTSCFAVEADGFAIVSPGEVGVNSNVVIPLSLNAFWIFEVNSNLNVWNSSALALPSSVLLLVVCSITSLTSGCCLRVSLS